MLSKTSYNVFLAIIILMMQPLYASQRIALVIGNANYLEKPLKNPVNDAKDITISLEKKGFKVNLIKNASKRVMQQAIRKFERDLTGDGKIGLFYYAGHGVEVDGTNYLVPVDADIQTEADVEFEAVNAGRVLSGMEHAGNSLNIVVLDACRDNPYKRSFRSASRGLQRMDVPKGSVIFYAATPGNVAQDGSGKNSPFTTHFLESMNRPNIKIEEVFKLTARAVDKETAGKQVPWLEGVVLGDFYFTKNNTTKPNKSAKTTQPSSYNYATPNSEIIFWQSIQNNKDCNEYLAYLSSYPDGEFVALAHARQKSYCKTNSPRKSNIKVAGGLSANDLLEQCDSYFQSLKLTSGSGGNAFSCYQEVLGIDPNNDKAFQGIKGIEDKYVSWVKREINKHNITRARRFLDRLISVNKNHPNIITLENSLAELIISSQNKKATIAEKKSAPINSNQATNTTLAETTNNSGTTSIYGYWKGTGNDLLARNYEVSINFSPSKITLKANYGNGFSCEGILTPRTSLDRMKVGNNLITKARLISGSCLKKATVTIEWNSKNRIHFYWTKFGVGVGSGDITRQ